MFVTIINDCRDNNAAGRQCTRAAAILGVTPIFVGVKNDIEAAGNLLDILDASEGQKGIILVNVAPRSGEAHHFQNGTPFAYFNYKDTLVISSISGYTLSLIKRFGLIKNVQLLDIPKVLTAIVKQDQLGIETVDRISWSQFRSFDFLPRVAGWLWRQLPLPSELYLIESVPVLKNRVWCVDNFGNVKTSLLPEESGFTLGAKIKTKIGELICYKHLRDLPDNESGLVVGSSGIGDKRFLEIMTQGGSAAERFKLKVGDEI